MLDRNIEALVVQSSNDWLGGYVKWLTDIPATNGYPRSIIFHRDEPMTVVSMGAFDAKRDLAGKDAIQRGVGSWIGTPSFLSVAYTQGYEGEFVAKELLCHGYRRVGVVGINGMAHGFVDVIRTALDGKAEILDFTEPLDAIKAVKSPEELELVGACAHLQDKVFERVLSEIRPGMRDVDVMALAQYTGHQLGSEQGILLGGSAPIGQRSNFHRSQYAGANAKKRRPPYNADRIKRAGRFLRGDCKNLRVRPCLQ